MSGDEMRCAEVRVMLEAYHDGELESAHVAAVAGHLAGCADCAAALQAVRRASAVLREALPPLVAPDVLRARVTASSGSPRRMWWMQQVAAGLVIAAASSALTLAAVHRASPGSTGSSHEVIESHVRALMTNHLTDVLSSDQHTVKPWFDGKVDFSPEVPPLDSAGFPLIGGRVDYVGRRAVAGLVYGRRKHVISVYTWPVEPSAMPDIAPSPGATERGYNVIRWRHAGMEFWAVSDVNPTELGEFVRTFQGRPAPGRL